MARVVLENLCKTFKCPKARVIHAVNKASLTVEDKELLVLVGPSGCGKTTTLRLIAGLDDITSGNISIDGRLINAVPPKDRDIDMVFQSYALYPHMTVYENMAFGLKLRKFPRAEIETRVRNAATILGLQDCLDRRPAALSGGQRQRVAVGRAIVRQPKVFLFDEPLSNLDAKMRVQMRHEISRLHTRLGATMIYVTHDQVEAMTLGDRIAVMKDGVIQQVADPMTLYRQPANLFVAGFIGAPAMNFLHGSLVRKSEGTFFQAGGTSDDGKNILLRVPEETASKLGEYAGKKIVLGIRPENVAANLSSNNAPTDQTVNAVAEVIEPTGPETNLYAVSGGHSCVARLPADANVKLQQAVSLVFDMRKAHFFDPATEKVISV